MTIEEVKKSKIELESIIQKFVGVFEQLTGCIVDNIKIEREYKFGGISTVFDIKTVVNL